MAHAGDALDLASGPALAARAVEVLLDAPHTADLAQAPASRRVPTHRVFHVLGRLSCTHAHTQKHRRVKRCSTAPLCSRRRGRKVAFVRSAAALPAVTVTQLHGELSRERLRLSGRPRGGH